MGIRDALLSILDSKATWILSDSAELSIKKNADQLTAIIPKVEQGVAQGIQDLEKRFNKALNEYTGELPHVGKTGDVKKVKTDELKAPKGNELTGAKAKLIPMKKYKPPCFTPGADLAKNFKGGKKTLEKEFYKQLKAQQAGINKMSVGEYLNNRKILTDLTGKHGHSKARQILTKGGSAQKSARKDLENEIYISVRKSLRKKNIKGIKAKEMALEKVKDQMTKLAALHDPDLIAGGGDNISRLGNKNVNSSLGSQWSKSGRVTGMDNAAKLALSTQGSSARMNIELERCK